MKEHVEVYWPIYIIIGVLVWLITIHVWYNDERKKNEVLIDMLTQYDSESNIKHALDSILYNGNEDAINPEEESPFYH